MPPRTVAPPTHDTTHGTTPAALPLPTTAHASRAPRSRPTSQAKARRQIDAVIRRAKRAQLSVPAFLDTVHAALDRLDPGYPAGIIALADRLSADASPEAAAAAYRSALHCAAAELPTDIPLGDWSQHAACRPYLHALCGAGRMADEMARAAEAEAHYLSYLSICPSDPDGVRLALAHVYLRAHRYDDAFGVLEAIASPRFPAWVPRPQGLGCINWPAVAPTGPAFEVFALPETAAIRLLQATAAHAAGYTALAAVSLYRSVLLDPRVAALLGMTYDLEMVAPFAWNPRAEIGLEHESNGATLLPVRPGVIGYWHGDTALPFLRRFLTCVASVCPPPRDEDASPFALFDPTTQSTIPSQQWHAADEQAETITALANEITAHNATIDPCADETMIRVLAPFLVHCPPQLAAASPYVQ